MLKTYLLAIDDGHFFKLTEFINNEVTMITKDIIERVKDSANIFEVVSEYISLKKQGVYYVGLCPFHDDHHPSMKVSPNRGTYHCYSCDAKGDAIKFVQEIEHVSFPEAVRRLANKYGISIPSEEKSEEEKKHDRLVTNLYKTNAWVAKFYVDALTKSAEDSAVKQYIRMRGISDEILSKFLIGYSPADTSIFAKEYKEAGLYFNNAKILGLGYVGRGFVKDRYAGRLIFPWFNTAGKVVGFGARKLDERTHGVDQKYINSQESEIFHKKSELYGLYQAKSAILKAGKVYMVEGYTDVLAFHQAGIENVVANSGTALTQQQVMLLARYCKTVTLIYDSDEAGKYATMRAIPMFLKHGMTVNVLLLPEGEDPDSFIHKSHVNTIRQTLNTSEQDFLDFMFSAMVKDVANPDLRSTGVKEMLKVIAVIQSPITKETYIQECSRLTGYSVQSLMAELAILKK